MRTFLLRGKNFLSPSGVAETRESSIIGYLLREVGRGKWRLIPRGRNNVWVVCESDLPEAAHCVLGVPNCETVTQAYTVHPTQHSRCRSVFKKERSCIPPKSKQKGQILMVCNSSLFKKRFKTASNLPHSESRHIVTRNKHTGIYKYRSQVR